MKEIKLRIKKVIRIFIAKRENESRVPNWERRLSAFLEVLILLSALFQVFFGDTSLGALILLCLFIILIPSKFTRNKIVHIPIEIEIILFVMIVIQFILGSIADLYNNFPFYDKFVHFMLPFLVGLIGFTIAFVMHVTGRYKASLGVTIVIITLISLGVGALWEIVEYASDHLIYPFFNWHHFQGNPWQSVNDDTMTDLVEDLLGGLFGALLGVFYIRNSARNKSPRLIEFVEEFNEEIYQKK